MAELEKVKDAEQIARDKLIAKNKQWTQEGRIPNDGVLYSNCPRCADTGLRPEFQPIERFNTWSSTSDHMSTYCTMCLSSGLNKKESLLCAQLMVEHGIRSDHYKIYRHGAWENASDLDAPAKALQESVQELEALVLKKEAEAEAKAAMKRDQSLKEEARQLAAEKAKARQQRKDPIWVRSSAVLWAIGIGAVLGFLWWVIF